MCDFCDDKMNITNLECSTGKRVYYCPFCGDAMDDTNKYFISLRGGTEVYWVKDLHEAAYPSTLAYVMSNSPQYHFEIGIPIYRAVQVGMIQGYPKVVKH